MSLYICFHSRSEQIKKDLNKNIYLLYLVMFNPNIYRHRDKYITRWTPFIEDSVIDLDNHIVLEFRNYARERMSVWNKKNSWKTYPRTDDKILQKYKFCNVYRELDRQTIYIHTKLQHLRDNFELWLLNVMISRFIGKIETLEQIWIYKPEKYLLEKEVRGINWTKYGDAYLFPPQIPLKLWYSDRADFIFNYLPNISNNLSKLISSFKNENIYIWVSKIVDLLGVWLKFHFTEILIDVAYQYPELIDLNGNFPIWPWSKPTMKRFNSKANIESICLKLVSTQPKDFPYLEVYNNKMLITAEWIEGLGCEFRKYTNLKNWKGKSRIYKN